MTRTKVIALIAVAATALVAIAVIAANSGGSSSSTGVTPAPTRTGTVTAPGGQAAPPQATFPAQLIGTWNSDDPQRIGTWLLTFDAAGRYEQRNDKRQIRILGVAAVNGNQIAMQPNGGQASVARLSLSGGTLTIGSTNYIRLDAGGSGQSNAGALVGNWLNLGNNFKTLTIASGGRFQLDDGTGNPLTGTYTVQGNRLTLTAPGLVPNYTWSIEGGILRLTNNGTVSEYVRAG